MATRRKNNYITADLDWSESQLETWKQYIDSHPINELKAYQVGKTVIKVEEQGKFIQETMKNYLALLEVVNNLREKEDQKKLSVRGDTSLSPAEQGML